MIQLLRLVTGEDWIADVEYDAAGDIYVCTNPTRVMELGSDDATHRVRLGLGPVGPFDNKITITIKAQHVVFAHEVAASLEATYRKEYGSGLTLEPASALAKLKRGK